ncbi:MAG: tRNA pseudouridine(38-40) synthase TruA [Lachnospiraceae bacterium]|nr:tRNA pseudouridine(38-40) synthase TruA [Lachnospiraceae bacterium]
MRRILLTIAYDGTNYVGWQAQPNGTSIEEVLGAALSRLLHEEVRVTGASRTDSGVHADGNLAVFDTGSRIPAEKFTFALNPFLPEDIKVQASREVPPSFHPRKMNSVKTYEYRILNRTVPVPKERNYAYFYYYPLDAGKMDRAAKALLGEHDFTSFCSIHTNAEDRVRRIYACDVRREGEVVTLRISGSGFLYNMVRIIAGTLVQIGSGLRPEADMAAILEARDRAAAGPKAPAQGLTLKSIRQVPEVPDRFAEENPHWAYRLEQNLCLKVPGGPAEDRETPAARLYIDRCDPADYDGLLIRMTKALSRNGAVLILVKDRTGRLTDGETVQYFTYRRLPEAVSASFPEEGPWFLTYDPRKAGADDEEDSE